MSEIISSESLGDDGQSQSRDDVARKALRVLIILGVMLVVMLPVGIIMDDEERAPRSFPEEEWKTSGHTIPRSTTENISAGVDLESLENGKQGVENSEDVPARKYQPSSKKDGSGNLSSLVHEYSDTARTYATNCRRNGGTVLSGSSGDRLCSASNFTLTWPSISVCGPLPGDTKWTVFRGDSDAWDITIDCAGRRECNGPSNALCTRDGCTFSKTCLPE